MISKADNGLALSILLTKRDPHPPLTPKKIWKPELRKEISLIHAPADVIAGLHLWNDDIESCHAIAQATEKPNFNYWHAILHRREGDFGNSKYWYRAVGDDHPVLLAMKAAYPNWDPIHFVDHCEKHENTDTLMAIQAQEMERLLQFCRPSDS